MSIPFSLMRKKLLDEPHTKAKKRELKKRPRMSVHARSLKTTALHSGKAIIKKRY